MPAVGTVADLAPILESLEYISALQMIQIGVLLGFMIVFVLAVMFR